ncbi:MAG: 23S rRNA (uracil(1939)-C(5))-methyltransferase RlmD [Clostridiales bacterium]|nr:23S rRNA (uracil(1939)-C(5))-methyltransferase RlmD [Clostridiales bacterium]
MKHENTLQKNTEITLAITALGSEGQGIGRLNGLAIFVPYTLPGETVRALVIKARPNYAIGKLAEVLEPSPHRVTPRCAVHEKCGGCGLQHLAYAEQLIGKRQAVTDALTRIGGFAAPSVSECVGMENPWHYRNKGAFPFGSVDGRPTLGMFAARSHRLIPITDCPLQGRAVMRTAMQAGVWARRNKIPAYDESTGAGILRHIIARETPTGEVMATLVTNGGPEQARGLADALQAESLYHNKNTRQTNAITSEEYTHLSGAASLLFPLNGLIFAAGPASFLQVNTAQTEKLYALAIETLNPQPHERITDLYCGIGTLTLGIAQRAKEAIGIESVPQAVADARENAARNGIQNVRFLTNTVEEGLPKLLQEGPPPDAILLDPPRKGAEPAALDAIVQSGAARIVYVSCNPATLARDLRILCDNGYTLQSTTPVDLFPHTPHVETVALLGRV